MARVQLARAAVEDLDRMIKAYNLPADTRDRVSRSLSHLEAFPLLGPELRGRWAGFRFLLGPWRWMIVVYVFIPEDDRVVVVTIQDGRTANFTAPDSSDR